MSMEEICQILLCYDYLHTVCVNASMCIKANLHISVCSLQCELGEGQFGKIKKGIWLGPGQIEVAVKILKEESEKVKLLKEAAIMGQFAHPNIVQLYGLTTITEPVS